MTLFVKCKNCSNRFDVKASVITRSELEDKWGRYFKKQCTGCLSTQAYHVNNVRAEMNDMNLLCFAVFCVVVGIAITYFFWGMEIFIGLSIVIPIAAISYYAKVKAENVNVFNRLMVKRDEERGE